MYFKKIGRLVNVSEIKIGTNERMATSTTETNLISSSTITMDTIEDSTPTIPSNVLKEFPRLRKFTITSDYENMVFSFNDTSWSDSFELIENNESKDVPNEEFIIPLKVILPLTHAHAVAPFNGSYLQYDHIIYQTNDSTIHKHFNDDKPLHLFPLADESVTPTTEEIALYDDHNDTYIESHTDKNDIAKLNEQNVPKVFTDQDGFQYQWKMHRKVIDIDGKLVDEFDQFQYKQNDKIVIPPAEMVSVELDESEIEVSPYTPEDDNENNIHYGRMMQWIYFQL